MTRDLPVSPTPGEPHACYDEHQPGCDCVIPAQTIQSPPSYLDRLVSAEPDRAEGGEGRDVSGETVMGMRVAGYRWKTPVLDTFSWSYASHWSTPGEHVEAERLFTEADVRRILSSSPSQEQAGAVARPYAVPLKVGQEIDLHGHRWEVEGVHLGDVGQESLIQLKGLSHKPGWTGPWEFHPMIFVPEIMLSAALYAHPQQQGAVEVARKAFDAGIDVAYADITGRTPPQHFKDKAWENRLAALSTSAKEAGQ